MASNPESARLLTESTAESRKQASVRRVVCLRLAVCAATLITLCLFVNSMGDNLWMYFRNPEGADGDSSRSLVFVDAHGRGGVRKQHSTDVCVPTHRVRASSQVSASTLKSRRRYQHPP